MTAIAPAAPPARRDQLTRRIRLLVAATMSYNVIEAVIAVTAGTIASSTALIAFGLDSVIEVSSAAAVAWQGKGCCAAPAAAVTTPARTEKAGAEECGCGPGCQCQAHACSPARTAGMS